MRVFIVKIYLTVCVSEDDRTKS